MLIATLLEENGQSNIVLTRDSGEHILTHQIRPNHRPYVHPITAPDGVGVLTQDSPDHHPWQHGLYTGLNLVNGEGFWKEFDHDGTIHPELISKPVVDGDTVSWALNARWMSPQGDHLVTETQRWSVTDRHHTYVFDMEWTLHAEVDLEIGEYMAGGLFLRMPYREERGGYAVNASGLQNSDAERQRDRWVLVSMPIEGRHDNGGAVIMDHPNNPDHPVTWRVDHELGISPSRCIAGSWNIPQGESERYLYRIVVFTGNDNIEEIEKEWQSFTSS